MIHGINNQYDSVFTSDIVDKLWSTKISDITNSLNDEYFNLSELNDNIRLNMKKYIEYPYFAYNLHYIFYYYKYYM